ncbi:MAG: acyl-CoA carboxylase epsilon subunit [Streptosporangiaceae bacterium]
MTGLIRIVRGNPDDTELAALIAALLAARSPSRSGAPGDALPADRPARASWCHSEAGYRSPRSWSSR